MQSRCPSFTLFIGNLSVLIERLIVGALTTPPTLLVLILIICELGGSPKALMQTNQQPVQYVPANLPPQRPRRGCGCMGGALLGVIVLVLLVGVGGAAAAG